MSHRRGKRHEPLRGPVPELDLVGIGWVIVGGMLVGTLFTLFVLPMFYTYIARRDVAEAETRFA